MIDLKDRPDLGWNTLFAVSAVAILAALWFQFGFVVKPPNKPADNEDALRAKSYSANDKKDIAPYTWDVSMASMDALGPAVLNSLTALSEKNTVQLTSFRTDKSIRVAGLDEAPFVAVVEGAFPDVLAFTHALESPSSRLAVNLIELSASDSGPGHVTATFGLLGFFFKEPK